MHNVTILIDKAGTVVGLNPEDLEGAFVLGELGEVALGEDLLDFCFVGRVDQGDAGAFEAGTREATAVDAGEAAHDFVDGDELGGAALVVVDAGFATVERELSEELEVACFPGCDTLAHTTVFAVEVLCTAGEAGGHGDTGLIEGGLGDIAQEGLIEGFQGLLGIGEHVPSGGLAFVDTEVVIGIDKASGQTTEEDANLKLGHLGMALDDAPVVAVAIEEE